MAVKKVTYKEPKGYFNADMLRVAEEWDRQEAQKQKEARKQSETQKKTTKK